MGKKIYISEEQLQSLVENRNKNKRDINMDCIKANRKAQREEFRDIYGDGFKSTTRIAKSEKQYSRKGKNKFNKNNFPYDD